MEVPSRKVDYSRYLIYGDSSSGDFIFKAGLKLVLDFDMTDQYGNPIEITSTRDLFILTKVYCSGQTSAVNDAIIRYVLAKYNGHYQMTIYVNQIGTYQIEKNGYMTEAIRFSVISGEVSPTLSFCTLEGYTAIPTLEAGGIVKYNCFLRDLEGNEITTEIFKQNSNYDFSCKTERTSPSAKTYFNSVADKKDYYQCQYRLRHIGIDNNPFYLQQN